MSGRRFAPPGPPAANGHGPVDPRRLQIPAGVPIIGQRHTVTIGLGTSDGQPATVTEAISALAQFVLKVGNLEAESDALSAGQTADSALMGDVEVTLAVMRAACEFRRVLLEQAVALGERLERRKAVAAAGGPREVLDGGAPTEQPATHSTPHDGTGAPVEDPAP